MDDPQLRNLNRAIERLGQLHAKYGEHFEECGYCGVCLAAEEEADEQEEIIGKIERSFGIEEPKPPLEED